MVVPLPKSKDFCKFLGIYLSHMCKLVFYQSKQHQGTRIHLQFLGAEVHWFDW